MEVEHEHDPRVDVRSSLDRDGRELRLALQELSRVTRAKLDLRQHLVEHYTPVLLVGFLVGLWWGMRASHRRPIVLIATTRSLGPC
ncbi:hypothetical protein [Paraliomyxa miuraensis]|uniref:hypothetical protein n=1 Tax=Paraliomyxa miuraensis TaxID=376150 RepID=UPI0022502F0A|nr:hypothetical protein [Paraliomyxa miuraensis]MCX4245401.1 hypothetical protein [Paraliomyxa miuraensis]